MSGPRPQRSSYHQKALQQIRNSIQPFATCDTGSISSGISSLSSSAGGPTPPSPSYSPNITHNNSSPSPTARGIEYRSIQFPFVPSQVPPSVQQLLRRIDAPSSASSSTSSSPTSQLQPISKKPTLVIKSTVVPKPVLQTALPYALPAPQPPFIDATPPPLPPKPAKKLDVHPRTDFDRSVTSSPASQHGPSSNDPFILNNNNLHPYTNDKRLEPPPPPRPSSAYTPPTTASSPDSHMNGNCVTPTSNHEAKSPPPPPPPSTRARALESLSRAMKFGNAKEETSINKTAKPPPPPVPAPVEQNQPDCNDNIEQQPNEEIHTHESPIPERKKLSREKEEERYESKVRVYSPQAFKFFMEQHVENVIKSHQERMHRRMQLESEMVKIGLSDEAQTQMRKMLSQKESNYIRLKRAKMDKSLFKQIRVIGVGAFGEVALVRKLDTQHLYAMKTLRKSDVLRRKQVAHVKAERDILAEADNEWVVKLYYSFQDMDHLYFVMDYIPGGDLMSLLIKKGIFEESLARFYIAELTCAVESVHKMGFIHRDIKPDNILIDRDGHIKLTDFGLCTGFRWTHNSKYYQDSSSCCCPEEATWQICTCACEEKPLERRRKTNVRCLAHSLVGTPNYIAPEVLLRTGYTQLCDWWSVGVILYEMMVGQPPFLAPTPAETQYKVINWASTLRIPSQANVSNHAQDLILQLCTDHNTRLGMKGAQQVKAHPFFASVEFEAGLRRTVAPYIPKIRHPTDTSNFDPCDEDKLDESDAGPFDSNQFHGFFEFTFRRFFDDAYNEEGGPVYV